MQGAEECRLRRIGNTPQGETTEGNAADDTLMVDQGGLQMLPDPNQGFTFVHRVSENQNNDFAVSVS